MGNGEQVRLIQISQVNITIVIYAVYFYIFQNDWLRVKQEATGVLICEK